ncbi:MAG: VOC family protein [Candidatus Paceibacterota bacterium]
MDNKATIKHIEFWTSDLDRSIKFYEDIFGLIGWEKIEANAFSNGETKIYFIQQHVKSEKTVGPRHLCFLANSQRVVDEVANFLLKVKADIIRGPVKSKYNGNESYTIDFRDPDGYIIEVATKSELLRE